MAQGDLNAVGVLVTAAALTVLFALLLTSTAPEGEVVVSTWNKDFLVALLERVIATFIVTFLAATGLDAGVVGETGLDGIKWQAALATAGVAAGLSLLKGVLANLATKDGPSLTHAEQVQPTPAAPTDTPETDA